MSRRKRAFFDDDDPDSSAPSDEDDGDDMGSDRKRRRFRRKGMFDDSDGENETPRTRVDWTRAPNFVSKDSGPEDVLDETLTKANDEESIEDINGQDEEDSSAADDSEEDMQPDLKAENEEEDARMLVDPEELQPPPRAGLGLGASAGISAAMTSTRGLGGIGSGGIGSSFPTAFGGARTPQAFVRSDEPAATKPKAPLSAKDLQHFSSLRGSFGSRMMENMGWKIGEGLGTTGEGRVNPVDQKMRPKGLGIAARGFSERTDAEKAEARRRGDHLSDDEAPERGKKSKAKTASDAWRKPKKTKVKVQHKTYEEIIQEAGEQVALPGGVGPILDATGAEVRRDANHPDEVRPWVSQIREISSLADASASWTPSTDTTRLPEVRHNLRLIVDSCKDDLDGLAKEGKLLEDRRKGIQNQDSRLRQKIQEEAELIARMQKINLVAEELAALSHKLSRAQDAQLDSFTPAVANMHVDLENDFHAHNLDEIVVAAISPVVCATVNLWEPFEEPDKMTTELRLWSPALIKPGKQNTDTQLDRYNGDDADFVPSRNGPAPEMTPYESMLWNIWMPRVRASINNDWNAVEPRPAIRWFEAWLDLMPPFIHDNVLDQLILPKVSRAIAEWKQIEGGQSLQSIVFPWLPFLGLRMEEVLGEARRKVRSMLRTWDISRGIPNELLGWKNVFSRTDWEGMLLKYILPKLGTLLRDEFKINPRKQDLGPFKAVTAWANIMPPALYGPLFAAEFFPKWLHVLYLWLVSPNASYEEVAQWYGFWKSTFPETVAALPDVQNGFESGLKLMDEAMRLSAESRAKLPYPDMRTITVTTNGQDAKAASATPKRAVQSADITFRALAEEFAASHNLLFIPTGKTHLRSRMPIFRVSATVEGKGGLHVYVLDDAIWAVDGEDARAITLDEMVLRANRGR